MWATTKAGAGARLVYFSCLGLLMTAANGALDEQAATAQLRDVVTFVISTSGEEQWQRHPKCGGPQQCWRSS
ncbi:hypothetical protein [Streptomyces sp. NPDC059262]|uniref:hypothetical protein n=1 Tax=Streptomyces sp. NPDC059262 TaxID=3346797 RepID=UPI00368C1A9E